MNTKDAVTGSLITGLIVFVVSLVVAYLYSLIIHGNGVLDWESSIRLGIILGIVLTAVRHMDRKKGS
jgi:hypothetical protein